MVDLNYSSPDAYEKNKHHRKDGVYFLVREAGLEPARPEWTLEPEFFQYRFDMCRGVPLNAVQPVENTGFFGTFSPNPLQLQKVQFFGTLLAFC